MDQLVERWSPISIEKDHELCRSGSLVSVLMAELGKMEITITQAEHEPIRNRHLNISLRRQRR